MRAIVVEQYGGPEELRMRELPDAEPAPGQVVVEVAAAGVNYIDTYRRSGVYPVPLPHVPGSEGAGRVVAVGDGVEGVAVGDRVAWVEAPGSYAQHVVVFAENVVPVPDEVSDEVAAALPLQGMTAHYLVTSTYPVQAGDWALVHAAAGGVGLLLTQLVVRRGGRVIATASTEEKKELARAAGAEHVLGYDEVPERVREITDGAGVAVVYDGVGRATFDASVQALRRRGMLVLFGGSSGQVPPVDPQVLNRNGSLYLTRPTLSDYVVDREELLGRAADLFGWVAAGELTVRIGGTYQLADAAQAHEDLESRRTTGKLLVLPR